MTTDCHQARTTARLAVRAGARGAASLVPDRLTAPLSSAQRPLGPGHTGLLRRMALGWLRVRPIATSEPFTVAGTDPPVRLLPSDSYVAQRLYWLGLDAYEPGQPAAWAELVRTHRSVLDLGANIGLYSVVGATAGPSARYQAVEPHPSTCAELRKNLAINGLGHVEVVEAAVTAGPAQVVHLQQPDADPYTNPAGAYVAGAYLAPAAAQGVEVGAIPLGELVEGVDLVKLDIEGLEEEVLSSVRDWLVAERPTLMVEVLPRNRRLGAFLAELTAEAGYDMAAVAPRGLVPVPPSVVAAGRLGAQFGTRDVILRAGRNGSRELPGRRRGMQG